jgi:hypothetical protein
MAWHDRRPFLWTPPTTTVSLVPTFPRRWTSSPPMRLPRLPMRGGGTTWGARFAATRVMPPRSSTSQRRLKRPRRSSMRVHRCAARLRVISRPTRAACPATGMPPATTARLARGQCAHLVPLPSIARRRATARALPSAAAHTIFKRARRRRSARRGRALLRNSARRTRSVRTSNRVCCRRAPGERFSNYAEFRPSLVARRVDLGDPP